MDQIVQHDREARAAQIFTTVVNVKRRHCRSARVVTGRQIDVDRAAVSQPLACELELLDVAVRDVLDRFELGRFMEFADHEVGVLAADPVVDNVVAQGVDLPFAIDDEFVLEPGRLAEIQGVMEYPAVIDLLHNRELTRAAPLVELTGHSDTPRLRILINESDRGPIDHWRAERAQNFKESRHLFAFAVRGRFDAAAPGLKGGSSLFAGPDWF